MQLQDKFVRRRLPPHPPVATGSQNLACEASSMAQKLVNDPGIQLGAQQLATLLDSTREWISILGADGTIHFANSTTKNILGYRPEELLGRSLHAIVHGLDVERMRECLKEIATSAGGLATERCRLRCKDGSWRWFELAFRNRLEERGLE